MIFHNSATFKQDDSKVIANKIGWNLSKPYKNVKLYKGNSWMCFYTYGWFCNQCMATVLK